MTDLDRTTLPIRRSAFAGVVNRTLDGSQPDWNLIGHPTPPEGAPNVLLVLIDDAGFGNPSTFGGPDPDAELHADRRRRACGTTASTSPRCARRPGPRCSPGGTTTRSGFGSVGEFAGGFPGYSRHAAAGLRAAAADPAGQRLQHRGVRQVAPDPRRPAGSGRAVRPVAERLGLRLLLRVPRRRREPVGSVPGREPEDHRHPRGVLRRGRSVLLPRCDGRSRPSSGCTASAPRTPTSRSSCTSRPAAATRRTTSARSGPTSTRASSTRAGTSSARRPSPARRRWASSPPTPSSPPRDDAFPAWDDLPDNLKAFYARQMEVYAGLLGERRPQRRSRDRRDRRAGRARQHGDPLDLGRQRRQHGGHGHRLVQRADDAERHPAHRRDAAAALRALRRARRSGAPRSWIRTTAPRGPGPATRRSSGASRSARTSAAPATRWSCTGRIASRTPAGLRSQFTHVIDVAPTILDVAGHPASPRPSTGSSRSRCTAPRSPPSLRPTPAAPEHRTQQYFETIGNRAMYKDGWWLAMKTERIPWVLTPDALAPYAPGVWDPDAGPVELYYLPDDFTQANDLAAEHPDKVAGAQGRCSGRRRSGTRCCRCSRRCRRSSGMLPPIPDETTFEFRGDVQNVLSGMIPQDLQPLVLDHRRPRRAPRAAPRA